MTLLALLAALSGVFAPSAQASKTHLFLENFGSAATPIFNAKSLTIDRADGDLLVANDTGNVVSRWNPDGTPAVFSALGSNVIDGKNGSDLTPENGFEFEDAPQVAVDNSGSATDGNIYVAQEERKLVDIFSSDGTFLGQLTGAGPTAFGEVAGIAVDANGNVFVAGGTDQKIYKFDPSTDVPSNLDLTATFSTGFQTGDLAMGAGPNAGSLFADHGGCASTGVYKLDGSSGALQGLIDPRVIRALGVEPSSGHLYTTGGKCNNPGIPLDLSIKEYDASGSLVSSFRLSSGPQSFQSPHAEGIVAGGPGGTLYVATNKENSHLAVFGPTVTVPDVETGAGTVTGDTSVTVDGTIDPDGVALEECFFEYGTTNAYGQIAPCTEELADIGPEPELVHADLTGLTPETLYHFRLVATNENATVTGSDRTFKTPGKPTIEDVWASDVGIAAARVNARINPENADTTYRFEWGPTSTYGSSGPQGAIGSGAVGRTVSLVLTSLEPGTVYHYRVVATNSIGTTESTDHSFTTARVQLPGEGCPNQALRTAAASRLLDCRAYEMVSPIDKNGTDIASLIQINSLEAAYNQSASEGGKLTYTTSQGFGDTQSSSYLSQYIATRGAEGWGNHGITPPQGHNSVEVVPRLDVDFRAFTSDLCEGILLHSAEPVLAPGAADGYPNLYRRHNCGSEGYDALTVPAPVIADADADPFREVQGISADGSCVVFSAPGQLVPEANPTTDPQLYESCDGTLRLIGVLPDGSATTDPASAGSKGALTIRGSSMDHAVSADGRRVYWSNTGTLGRLYLRVNSDQAQSKVTSGQCTQPAKACTYPVSQAGASFWTAASDGSAALYSEGTKLYEFDLAQMTSTLVAQNFKGVMGASDDLARVYFVSTDELAPGASAGAPNLYLRESGAVTFVAALSSDDAREIPTKSLSPVARAPFQRVSRVSPDGHLAFTATGSPTGYDNADAETGEPTAEVYVYDPVGGELNCASCHPTGGRPRGRLVSSEVNGESGIWAASYIPGALSQLYSSRAITDDGKRVFFNSFQSLVPGDNNGRQDVYEWEAPGAGNCTESSNAYSPPNGGCLALVSSGQSAKDSEFVDASADGADVFFKTDSSLVQQDPGLVDIYDARAGGGYPVPDSPPAECEGEACQSPPRFPDHPTPGSFSYSGPGNSVVSASKPKRCRKGKVRRKGRCVRPKPVKKGKKRKLSPNASKNRTAR